MRLTALAILAFLFAVPPSSAACVPYAQARKALMAKYGEYRLFRGWVSVGGKKKKAVELWVNDDDRKPSWTIGEIKAAVVEFGGQSRVVECWQQIEDGGKFEVSPRMPGRVG